jgi:flagellar P-ring protein FlgI
MLLIKKITSVILCAFVFTANGNTSDASSQRLRTRIKDIAFIDGIRDNQLIGYGIVAGLNNTGDSLSNSPFTKESLISMLERLGINTRNINMDAKNIAAVMVTANLPPFARQGATIDISVSSLGSAKTLLGGTLLVTPLYGADGQVYAVAQGAVSASGFVVEGKNASQTKGVPTNGRIPNGAIIEREIAFKMDGNLPVRLSLRNPDFTTAKRISEVITKEMKTESNALDIATVSVNVPIEYKDNLVSFITRLEQLEITPDQRARVIIDDNTGLVAMGENVKISSVAIAHGSLVIKIKNIEKVSQPNLLAQGTTTTTTNTKIEVNEGGTGNLMMLDFGATLHELVMSLNAIGVTPRDLISILQAIKAAGALHADLETMS